MASLAPRKIQLTRLKGDLYLLDGGITQLIIVDSSPEKGNSNLGEYIVYSIKECGILIVL